MDKNTIVKIRTMLKNNPNKTGAVGTSPVFVICDNLRYLDERTHFLKWDDTNEILYAIMSPEYHNNRGLGAKAPIQLIATAYEHIQYIGQQFTSDSLKSYIGTQLGLTAEQIELIRKQLDPNGEERIKSIRTQPQLDVLAKEDAYTKSQLDYDHNRPRDI